MFYIIFQSIVVYAFVIWVLYYLSKQSARTNNYSYVCFALLLYSIIFGLRYGVGIDTMAYVADYEEIVKFGENAERAAKSYETGFWYLSLLCAKLNFPSELYLGIIAFIQLFFSVLAFKNQKGILPYIFLVFMLSCCFLSYNNGLRQVLATSLWLYSLKFAVEKKVLRHYSLIFLAFLFHKSALFLVVFYPLINLTRLEWFRKIKTQYIILGASIALMTSKVFVSCYDQIELLAGLTGYSNYFESNDFSLTSENNGSYGLGFFLLLFLNVLIISKSKGVKEGLNTPYITKLYDFFFIGICLSYVFDGSLLLARINNYFYNSSFIIGGCTLYFLLKSKSKSFYLLLAIYVLLFLGTLYRGRENSMYFVFSGQEDLYYIKQIFKQ